MKRETILYISDLINESNNFKKAYNYEKAYEKAKKALLESRKIEYKEGIVFCNQIISHISYYSGNYLEVMECEQEIVNYALKVNNKDLLATHYIALSAMYIQLYELDQAKKLIYKAKSIAKELHNEIITIKIYMNLGYLAYKEYAYKDAEDYYNYALKLGVNNKVDKLKARIQSNLGLLYVSKNEKDKAISCYRDAIKAAKLTNDLGNQVDTSIRLSQLLLDIKEFKESEILLLQVYDIVKEKRLMVLMRDILKVLSDIYQEKKDYKTANEYLYKYIQINAEVLNDQKQNLLTNLKVKYEIMQKEQETEIYRLKNEELRIISITDPLTKVYNRSYFFKLINKLYKQYKNVPKYFCCAIIDVDNYKIINDTQGHLYGDYILKEIVKIIKVNIGETDVVGRFGGDEFLILFPNGNIQDSLLMINKIINMLNKSYFEKLGKDHIVTLSIGLTDNKINNPQNFEDIINNADKALYKAKENGKNQCVISSNL